MRVRDWLDRFLFTEEVTISDLTADTSAFELLGPDAYSIAEESLDLSLDGVQPHQTIPYPLAQIFGSQHYSHLGEGCAWSGAMRHWLNAGTSLQKPVHPRQGNARGTSSELSLDILYRATS